MAKITDPGQMKNQKNQQKKKYTETGHQKI